MVNDDVSAPEAIPVVRRQGGKTCSGCGRPGTRIDYCPNCRGRVAEIRAARAQAAVEAARLRRERREAQRDARLKRYAEALLAPAAAPAKAAQPAAPPPSPPPGSPVPEREAAFVLTLSARRFGGPPQRFFFATPADARLWAQNQERLAWREPDDVTAGWTAESRHGYYVLLPHEPLPPGSYSGETRPRKRKT